MATGITANQFLLIEQKFKDIENQLSELSNRLETTESSAKLHHVTQ